MRFSTYLSDAHKRFNNLTAEKILLVQTIATSKDVATVADRIADINSELMKLEPELAYFNCGQCGSKTPVKEKAELGIGWGTVERGDQPPVWLDSIVGESVRGGLAIRLCHSCAIETGAVTVEQLNANLLPANKDGVLLQTDAQGQVVKPKSTTSKTSKEK